MARTNAERLLDGLKPADLGKKTEAQALELINNLIREQGDRETFDDAGEPLLTFTDAQKLAGARAELIRIRIDVLTGKQDELGSRDAKLKKDYAARIAQLNRQLYAARAEAGMIAPAAADTVTASVVRFRPAVVLPEELL